MVNETIEIAATHILDFNLEKSVVQLQQQQQSHTTLQLSQQQLVPLQRSSSGIAVIDEKQKHLNKQQQDPLSVSFSSFLPKSAENLSWKFFEQVSSLDNQLRNDETTSVIRVNGCQLMTPPPPLLPSHLSSTPLALNDHLNEDSVGKSNGFMPGATKNLSAEILSQHSPDLIQQQQLLESQQARHATFQFTSPTATFKRKKKQQQQQSQQQNQHQNQQQFEQHQQQQQINNNYNCNNKNQLQAPYEHHQQPTTPCKSSDDCLVNQTKTLKRKPQQQQHVQHHHHNGYVDVDFDDDDCDNDNDNDCKAATTAMISNVGVVISNSDTTTTGTGISTGTGTGTTHSFKTRTLPSVSIVQRASTSATATADNNGDSARSRDGGDDITKPIYTGKGSSRRTSNRQKQRMGATLQHSADSFVDGIERHFGLIGWRKKCLYTLLALLLLLIIINLALTLWILRVMEFSTHGMGLLKIVPGGIQLTGQAVIMDMLRASTIRSRHGQPIAIESSRNFSINTRDTNGMLENHLFLGHDKLECLSTGFRINDTAGRNLFSVNRNEVTIGAHALRIDGEGGAIFRESIQTPHVRAEPGRELRLESPTRQLEMTAARDINLQSRAGGIELSALEDVKLSTLDGSIRLESTKILMPNLRTAQAPIPGQAQSREHLHRVFQLCACSNGKLFLAAPHSICAGDDSTVCR